MDKDLGEKIHQANIIAHRLEAEYYEFIHPEVYGRQEQKRILSTLHRLDSFITDNHKRALDFGSGTGTGSIWVMKQVSCAG